MKKTYLIPTINVVEVKMEQLLGETSLNMTSGSASVNGNNEYNTLGRGDSDWDDED